MQNLNKILFFIFLSFSVFSVYKVNAQNIYEDKNDFGLAISSYDVLIYPNPVTDNKFYVKSEKVIKIIEVLNVLGQNIKTIYNETNVAYNILIELGDIQKGVYMVRVVLINDKVVIKKVIFK